MTIIVPSSGVRKGINKKGAWSNLFGVMGMVYLLIVLVVQSYIQFCFILLPKWNKMSYALIMYIIYKLFLQS